VEVYPEYAEGLQDLEGFSHIFLLYAFHESSDYSLLVKPFLDDQLHGLFATRYPARPNPIGLSVVRLITRQGNTLEIEGGGYAGRHTAPGYQALHSGLRHTDRYA
jgi:tRNA (Thr-GGU) A37 N-methylase